jgi:hypothetical protein
MTHELKCCHVGPRDRATGIPTICFLAHGHDGAHDDGVLTWFATEAAPARPPAPERERVEGLAKALGDASYDLGAARYDASGQWGPVAKYEPRVVDARATLLSAFDALAGERDRLREVISETYDALVRAGPKIGDLAGKGLPYAVDALAGERDEWKRNAEERAAQIESHAALIAFHQQRAESAERALGEAREALADACDVAVWMSGSNDFSPDGKAAEGWEKARPKLHGALAVLSRLRALAAASPGTTTGAESDACPEPEAPREVYFARWVASRPCECAPGKPPCFPCGARAVVPAAESPGSATDPANSSKEG